MEYQYFELSKSINTLKYQYFQFLGLSLASNGLDLFSLLGHANSITALTFITGSKNSGDVYLASGSEDGQLSFWDMNTR